MKGQPKAAVPLTGAGRHPNGGELARVGQWPRKIVAAGLRGYQVAISPWLPSACRFAPTCSEYARQAVERYGVLRGGWLAVCRLGRCHPFHAGGWDPVPERGSKSKLVLRTHKSL